MRYFALPLWSLAGLSKAVLQPPKQGIYIRLLGRSRVGSRAEE